MVFRHQPVCFGCGPDSPVSLGIAHSLTDDGVASRICFGSEHQGAPGLVHRANGLNVPYPMAPAKLFKLLSDWRDEGTLQGLELR